MNILVHFWAASLLANWLLFRTSGIRAAVEQCTSLYTAQRRVCNANSLLHGTTDIPVRSDTLSIFDSGTKYIACRKPFEIDC